MKKRVSYDCIFHFFWNAIFYGFTPNQFMGLQIYNKKHNEKKDYINYWRAKRILKKYNNKDNLDIFINKNKFNITFKKFIKRRYSTTNEPISKTIDLLHHNQSLIAKPLDQSCGNGVVIIHNDKEIETLFERGNYIFEEIVINHRDLKCLSDCLNTVRVYTLLKDNKPQVLGTYLRVGGMNQVVDNFHAGGHILPVDWETGIILSHGATLDGKKYEFNPKSNISYKGFKLPNWDKIKQEMASICSVVPDIRYVGWDIAITENGFELIEGNILPDPCLLQMYFGPCYHFFK